MNRSVKTGMTLESEQVISRTRKDGSMSGTTHRPYMLHMIGNASAVQPPTPNNCALTQIDMVDH